ncbi:GNAT family N-acetyltransferase [Marinicella sp. S1101]|uniref:GNAT family N-acetyltransferase n=1 Tax=Marinicella marina TaxID=2996016 RepID=UPI0022609B21|nr:GNAT family N-acetyltransferase [Marinicella marina]MCX7553033.1 GNAT family N-acetyltransferase [Marinicella marina]MDJ1139607.1 GNAT family N-acetyltransferase [Marinicella marina]
MNDQLSMPPSNRLSYALMGPADTQLLFELDQDAEVMRYINGGKMTSMQEIHDVFIPRMVKYTNPTKGWGLWQVRVTANDEFIGWILVRPMNYFTDNPSWDDWELGWRFKRKAWGAGYATEAAQHIMQTLASSQDVGIFSAIAMPDNLASIAVMKKLGMQYTKTAMHKDPLGDMEVVYYQVKAEKIRNT